MAKRFTDVCDDPVETNRYRTLITTLRPHQKLFRDKTVLDFGASYGLSMCALLELGAKYVNGVEPDAGRVRRGRRILEEMGLRASSTLLIEEDTQDLPFKDQAFPFVLANAVLEHIPQPRGDFIIELWRIVKRGGYMLVADTPNKYFPKDVHTTGLWWIPWLPSSLAHTYAVLRGRFDANRKDWPSSGWRGLGYYELLKYLPGAEVSFEEETRRRHTILRMLGLPPTLIDPYPRWLVRKTR